ncbi:type III secretion system chaperone [Roseibium sp. AS2]|uniref:type III secretion system chaperone n=1 Tax=Roseibium sp. AS2 TaxID=3135781 RepID=UPI00316BF248
MNSSRAEKLDLLCSETFRLMGSGAATACRDPEIWVLEFETGPPCFLVPVEKTGSFLLTAPVAPLPGHRREALYKLLFLANEQSMTADGMRLGLDGAEGDVTLTVDLGDTDIPPQVFLEALKNFRNLQEIWSTIIVTWQGQETHGGEAAAAVAEPTEWLRI